MEGIGSASSRSPQGFWRRLVTATVGIAVLIASVLTATSVAQDPSPTDPLGDLPLNPEWLSNTLERASTTASVKNNTVDGAVESRDRAIAEWQAAQKSAKKFRPRAKRAKRAAKLAA